MLQYQQVLVELEIPYSNNMKFWLVMILTKLGIKNEP